MFTFYYLTKLHNYLCEIGLEGWKSRLQSRSQDSSQSDVKELYFQLLYYDDVISIVIGYLQNIENYVLHGDVTFNVAYDYSKSIVAESYSRFSSVSQKEFGSNF